MRNLLRKGDVGIGLREIVGIVLILFSFVAVYAILKNYGNVAQSSSDIDACRVSVLRSSVKIAGVIRPFGDELKCPTKNLNIIGKGDEKVDGEENVYVDNVDEVKEVIAKEMHNCWYKFGNGETDVINGLNLIKDKACFVCSDIRFGNKLKDNTKVGYEINNFEQYLINTKVPGRSINYYEYLAGNVVNAKNSVNFRIDQPLAVVYVVSDSGIFGNLLVATGLGSLPIAGASAAAIVLGVSPPGWITATAAAGIFMFSKPADSNRGAAVAVVPLNELKDCRVL